MAIVVRGQGQQLNHEIKLLKHKIWSPVVSGLCYVKKKNCFLKFSHPPPQKVANVVYKRRFSALEKGGKETQKGLFPR